MAHCFFDTGSPNTLLNYIDSRRLNIPFTESFGNASIGGNKYKSYSYPKLEVLFKTTQNQVISEEISIKILRPSFKSTELEELDDLPNLLGLDFLKKGWRFFCDINNDEIYFEKE